MLLSNIMYLCRPYFQNEEKYEKEYLSGAHLDSESDIEEEVEENLNVTFTMSDLKKVRESLERSTEKSISDYVSHLI